MRTKGRLSEMTSRSQKADEWKKELDMKTQTLADMEAKLAEKRQELGQQKNHRQAERKLLHFKANKINKRSRELLNKHDFEEAHKDMHDKLSGMKNQSDLRQRELERRLEDCQSKLDTEKKERVET